MRLPDRSDRAAWADAAYDVAWRILHDREAAIEAAVHGLEAEGVQGDDIASAVLLSTCHRAAGMLAARQGERPPLDQTPGLAFVRDESDSEAPNDPVRVVEQAWGAAEALGAIDASLVDLHLRFRVSAATMAPMLRTDPAGAEERLERLRGRLEGALASWALWNEGKPRCDDLAAEIRAMAPSRFGPEIGRCIAKHAVDCSTCHTAMAVNDSSRVAAFASAPVLRAPAAVLEALLDGPTRSSSVFVDAGHAEAAGAPDPTTTAGALTGTPPSDSQPHLRRPAVEVSTADDANDTNDEDDEDADVDDTVERSTTFRQPGILAGVLLGLFLAVVLIGLVTAWAVTSTG